MACVCAACQQQLAPAEVPSLPRQTVTEPTSLDHMLTRRFPRDFPKGCDPWQVILETAPVPIRQRDPSLPPRLAEVIDHALVDGLEIGFPTAPAFKQALLQVL